MSHIPMFTIIQKDAFLLDLSNFFKKIKLTVLIITLKVLRHSKIIESEKSTQNSVMSLHRTLLFSILQFLHLLDTLDSLESSLFTILIVLPAEGCVGCLK